MWKSRVNQVLSRLTGYELRNVSRIPSTPPGPTPAQREAAERAARERAARRAERQAAKRAEDEERQRAKEHAREPARAKRAEFPAHWGSEAHAIINRVKPRTMTSSNKLIALVLAARYVAENDIPGDIVECGVWRGGSMQAVALTLLEAGDTSRRLHLFDTYEGMPPPTVHDRRIDGPSAAELLESHARDSNIWAVATLDDVMTGMSETGYPEEQILYHQGLVEQTVPAEAPDTIALLRLDTDWYESTRHELEHLYDRLSPGGVLILDDFGHWEGARKATLEFFESRREPVLLLPAGTGRIAVKPARRA